MTSLYGSLLVGVTSLQAQGNKINQLSQNISNANTVGYKSGTTTFADLITNDTASAYSASGVESIDTSFNTGQGEITQSQSPTDLAISGNGFFAVSQNPVSGGNILYTRAGSFAPDKNGNLVNSAGFYLQAWQLDANGNLPGGLGGADLSLGTASGSLQPVNIQQLTESPVATSTVSVHTNLDSTQPIYSGTPVYDPADPTANIASGSIQPQFETPITIIDSTGASHNLEAGYLKTGTDSWAVELFATPASDVTAANGQVAAGTVVFNGDGSLASVSPSLTGPIAITWQNPAAAPSNIAFNLGTAGALFGTPGATVIGRTDGLTQLATTFNIDGGIEQNGIQPGNLTGINVASDGTISANFDNGKSQNLYRIPLATFIEPDNLTSFSSNVFAQSVASGVPEFNAASQGPTGTIQSKALESSNVDLSTDLTGLIVAQNAYQSSSKLLSIADTMLNDLVTMGAT